MIESDKVFTVPGSARATEKIVNEFVELIDFIDVRRLRKNLRLLTLHFISSERDDITEDFREFLEELPVFFDFLDFVEEELLKQESV